MNAERRFGFAHASTGAEAVLDDDDIDAVFIATRHHSHAELDVRGPRTGQGRVRREAARAVGRRARAGAGRRRATGNDRLMVGFNRRFAPLLTGMKQRFGPAPSPGRRATS